MSFGGQHFSSAFGTGGSAFGSNPQTNTTNAPSSITGSSSSFRGGYSGRGRGGEGGNSGFRGGRGGFANKKYVAPGLQQQQQQQQGVVNMNDVDMDTSDQQQRGFAGSWSRGRGRGGSSHVGRGGMNLTLNNQSSGISNTTAANTTNAFGTSTFRGYNQEAPLQSMQWRADNSQNNPNVNNSAVQSSMAGGGFLTSNASSISDPTTAGGTFSAFGGSGNGLPLSTSGTPSTFGSGSTSSAFSTTHNSTGSSVFSSTNGISSASTSYSSPASTSFSGSQFSSAPQNSTMTTAATTTSSTRKGQGGNSTQAAKDSSSIFNQDEADSRLARFSAVPQGNRYDELKEKRVIERDEAIRSGAIPDPNKPRRLEDAIEFIGTCLDMCPEFERHEREYQQSLEKFEKIPGTESVDHARAVKAFARPAAGAEQPLPSDVRPPHVLLSTLAYLVENVIDENDLLDSHSFIRDRTRSIRQDFTLQNSRGIEAVKAHEIIARYHILCLHQLCEEEGERYSQQQEMEQLRKVLTSLQEFYDDLRSENIYCENEAEFRAYHILSHLHDPDMLRQAQQLPSHLFRDPFIQVATEIQIMTRRNNDFLRRGKIQSEASPNQYSRFFKKIASSSTSYLFACLLEVFFVDIRKGALKAMNKAFLEVHGGYPAEELIDTLGFDDLDECIFNCQGYGLEVDTSKGRPMIIFGRRDPVTRQFIFQESTLALKQHRNVRIVEAKRTGYTATQIIYGEAPPPMKKGIKTIRQTPGLSARPAMLRLNPAAPAFTPAIATASRPAAPPTSNSQAQTSVFGRAAVPPAEPTFSMPPPAFKPTPSPVPLPSSTSIQFSVPKQPAATPTFNFGVTPAAAAPSQPIPTAAATVPFPPTTAGGLFTSRATPPAPTQSIFSVAQAPSTLSPPMLTVFQPAVSKPAPSLNFNIPSVTASSTSSFSFQPSAPAPVPAMPSLALGQPVPLPLLSTPQPPTPAPPPQKPKSDATRVVAASGMVYPRSMIQEVMEDLVNAALSGFVRSVVAEAQHDEKLDRSVQQGLLRQQRVRHESQLLRENIFDHVVQRMVEDVVAEMLREHGLAKTAVRRWRQFTMAARARKLELRRRQRSFMQNVQAMSSRAGLGDNPIKTQLKAYQEEQRRSMRRYNGVVSQNGQQTAAGAAIVGKSVKDLVEVSRQRKQQQRADKIKEVGNADRAMLEQFEMLSAPKRERWAALNVNAIVQKGWLSTHPLQTQQVTLGNIGQQYHSVGPGGKIRWSLQVNAPNLQETGSQWIFSKLGVDVSSQSRTLYKVHPGKDSGLDVVIHGTDDYSVADLLHMSKSDIAETSAFLFVFSSIPFSEDEATAERIRHYWENEHSRLTGFLSCFPRVRQPIVFVMWGQSKSMWEIMSPRMMEYLDLANMVASEKGSLLGYQFIFVTTQEPNPGRFIEVSLDWLAKTSRLLKEDPREALCDLFNKFQPYYEGTLARMSVAPAPKYSQYESDKADSAFYDQYQATSLDDNADETGNLFVETVESALTLAANNFNLMLDYLASVVESIGAGDNLREGAFKEQEVKKGIARMIRESRLPVVVQGRFLDHIGFDLDAKESFCDYVDRYVSTIGGVAKDPSNLRQLRSDMRSLIMSSKDDRVPMFEVAKLLADHISQWTQQAILSRWARNGNGTSAAFDMTHSAFSHWLIADEVDVQDIVKQYETLADSSLHDWETRVMARVTEHDERADFIRSMKQRRERLTAATTNKNALTATRAGAFGHEAEEEELDADIDLDDDLAVVGASGTHEKYPLQLTNGGLKRHAPMDAEQDRDKRAKMFNSLALLTSNAMPTSINSNNGTKDIISQQKQQQRQLFTAFGYGHSATAPSSSSMVDRGYSLAADVNMSSMRSRRGSTASMASVSSINSNKDDIITRLRNRMKEVQSTILQQRKQVNTK